jgi:hypothetical protein
LKKKQIGQLQIKTPVIDLYEFKIENYSELENRFSKGFQMSKNQCGRIFTDTEYEMEPNANLSSCDLIETASDNDWENVIGEDLNKGYQGQEMTNLRLIKDLYSEYKNIPSKLSSAALKDNIHWNRFCQKWGQHFLETMELIKSRYASFFEQLGFNLELITSNSYIHRVEVSPHEKIIMMGDFHGSLHTFLRHLFRFHRLGIIDLKTFKLNHGYRLIFLGDIVDRGSFSLEISLVIFKLLEINNEDLNDPKVIYNRGNHEETDINKDDGLQEEISTRCPLNLHQIFGSINKCYSWLSSAVILEVNKKTKISTNSTNKSYRYWLCHGGFDPSLLNPQSRLSLAVKNAKKHIIPFIDINQQYNVRWSDFNDYNYEEPLCNKLRGEGFIYNRYHVYQFLKLHNISFIIRGHQDSYDNNYLFSVQYNIPITDLLADNIEGLPGFGLNYSVGSKMPIMGKKNTVVRYNEDFDEEFQDRLKGPFARLLANCSDYLVSIPKEKEERLYYYASAMGLTDAYDDNLKIFPVLTISTNTDYQRPLRADSFVVLRFDKDWTDPISGYLVENSQMKTINDLKVGDTPIAPVIY